MSNNELSQAVPVVSILVFWMLKIISLVFMLHFYIGVLEVRVKF